MEGLWRDLPGKRLFPPSSCCLLGMLSAALLGGHRSGVRSSSFMERLALADSRPMPAAGLLTGGDGHAVSKHQGAWKHSDFDT